MKKILFSILSLFAVSVISAQQVITTERSAAAFDIASYTVIYVDTADEMLVQKSAQLLQADIEMVTGKKIPIIHQLDKPYKNIIAVGTIKASSLIRGLISKKKLNCSRIENKWEAGQSQLLSYPFAHVDNILAIVGNDRRGTAYAVLEISKQIGVSPWYWWADVPVKKQTALYVKKKISFTDAPVIKYRGIFINDEAPALSGWSKEKFGGFNHLFYEKVFELMLRLKANYLWPAMWGNAFYDDDSLNIKTADAYGIVIGTSHHEPLMRAHDEWRRYGKGKWNYDSNEVNLKEFWKEGLARTGNTERIVSIGMRGDGDEPMSATTATALLERIVKDQRTIIEDVTRKPASATPQIWALYKEVQDYYDKGMRVPDDVTLLLCDDNWGNIRKLPKPGEKTRSGGYGIYYHFDYVGGPRNYKWLNTNHIARIWEQMHLAYEYNARQLWIVNVGDIKPMEFPTSFFLDYAWNPVKWNAGNLFKYTEEWATQQFGNQYANDIAYLLNKYTQYNSRRKPELLSPQTYSLTNYNEANRIVSEYNELLKKAETVNAALEPQYKDAFFQLVLHPIKACANLNAMYVAAAKNKFYSGNPNTYSLANQYAAKVKYFFEQDSLISLQYNKQVAAGKWNHMMDQTHIGYTYWQQPPFNKMPEVKYISQDSVKSPQQNEPVSRPPKERPASDSLTAVSIDAVRFRKVVSSNGIRWQVIPDIGRDCSGVTPFPVTAPAQLITANSPRLEYQIFVPRSGSIKLHCYFSPTLNFNNKGLRYAISIDDQEPQVIDMHGNNPGRNWNQWVADNIIIKTSEHRLLKPGMHVAKFWMIDPGIVFQKLVVDAGSLKPSYLGPPREAGTD